MSYNKINDLNIHNQPLQSGLQAAARRVLASGWFVLGPEVQAFEHEFAAYCGAEHCVGLANGTDALELALRALGVAVGDEVITAANAGMYSTTAILAIGATPVYVDIDENRLTLDPVAAGAAITSRTRAVIATHLYGQMADMPALRTLADRHGVALLEDCAQSHGAALQGRRVGTWGDAAAFSFYPTKNLGALGDGGAVVSVKAAVAERVRQLRQYGWQQKYTVGYSGGRNSRLDELQAALLRVKLPYLDAWNAARRGIAMAYANGIRRTDMRFPISLQADYVAHLYVIRTPDRDGLRQHLAAQGIASEVHYPILDCRQPILSERYRQLSLPVSEKVTSEILTLPCYPELPLSDVQHVCDAVNGWKA